MDFRARKSLVLDLAWFLGSLRELKHDFNLSEPQVSHG